MKEHSKNHNSVLDNVDFAGFIKKSGVPYMSSVNKVSIKIALIYVIICLIWILASDYLLVVIGMDTATTAKVSVLKGWFITFVTGIIIYGLVKKNLKTIHYSKTEMKIKDDMYKFLVDNTTDGPWYWDPDTGYNYMSPVWKEKLGYQDNEIENSFECWKSLVHTDDIDSVMELWNGYIERCIPRYHVEYRFRNKNGEYTWVLGKGMGIWDDNGRILKVVGTHTDITEQKITEEKLKKTMEENEKLLNEAIEYDKLRSDFFANISHELRTPLNVILGTVQLIEVYQGNMANIQKLFDRLGSHVKVIKQNCNRLLKLVNNLIDITRIDSGFLEISLKNDNIVDIVERITLSVSEFIENKSIELTFDTDVEDKIIACDADKIERIMLNLLSNATKYTKPGGNISVEVNDLEENVMVTVKDTGIGIPKDKLGLIFQRFMQVNTSLTRESEGSGIGLSLVQSFVEMHGGKVWAESTLGEGSAFRFTLPAKQLPSEADNAEHNEKGIKRVFTSQIEFSDIYYS